MKLAKEGEVSILRKNIEKVFSNHKFRSFSDSSLPSLLKTMPPR
jgi:hypothetical protein